MPFRINNNRRAVNFFSILLQFQKLYFDHLSSLNTKFPGKRYLNNKEIFILGGLETVLKALLNDKAQGTQIMVNEYGSFLI